MNCPTFVNSTICVEANVKINADVEVGEVDTCCIGRPFMRRCRNQDNKCVCMVFQRMRVRFPLIYSTNVTAHSAGVACEDVDTCRHSSENCENHRECCQKPCECYEEQSRCCQKPCGCYEEQNGCCQKPCECYEEQRECCQKPYECYEEQNECCQKPRECYEEQSGCCNKSYGCRQKSRRCSRDTRDCGQELSGCSQELKEGCPSICRNRKRVRSNNFRCPFVVFAALLCKGRCFRF